MSKFEQWWESGAAGEVIGKHGVRGAVALAWNAALEAAARAQAPMLRDMVSRGHAADLCRALKTEPPMDCTSKGQE